MIDGLSMYQQHKIVKTFHEFIWETIPLVDKYCSGDRSAWVQSQENIDNYVRDITLIFLNGDDMPDEKVKYFTEDELQFALKKYNEYHDIEKDKKLNLYYKDIIKATINSHTIAELTEEEF